MKEKIKPQILFYYSLRNGSYAFKNNNSSDDDDDEQKNTSSTS